MFSLTNMQLSKSRVFRVKARSLWSGAGKIFYTQMKDVNRKTPESEKWV